MQAADANTPAQTTSAQLTLLVAPILAITATNLPNAARGSAYSTTLLGTGGTQPISWSVAAGSALPAGLSLDSKTGTLAGIPTTAGTYSFTVIATDSSNPPQMASHLFTLQVAQPAPLVISTMSLQNATAAASYSATLTATGGVAPHTWSILSGSLPTGLSLNPSTGLISGKPTATGSNSFTVQVADASSPAVTATQNLPLTVNPQLGSGANNTEFKGSYAFLFRGFKNGSASGQVYGTATIGVLVADGNGNVTGIEDTNNTTGASLQVPITGEYVLGADNRGTLLLNNGSSLTSFAIAAGSLSAGTAQTIHFIEFDDSSANSTSASVGSGTAYLQTGSALAATTLKASFAYGLMGETPCNLCASSVIPFGSVTAVGIVTGDGNGNLAGLEDAAATNLSYPSIGSTGTYSTPDTATGRGNLTLSSAITSFPAASAGFVYYIVDANHLLVMSRDSHASASLLSGEFHLQTLATFSNASLSAKSVLWSTAGRGGDGVALYPSQLSETLSLLSVTGAGAGTMSQSSDNAGRLSSASGLPVTYSVASNGRVALTISGSAGPVFYLYAANAGIGFDLSQAGSSPGLAALQAQTISTSYPAFLAGSLTESTWPAAVATTATSGIEILSPNTGSIDGTTINGSAQTTLNQSSPTGNLLSDQIASYLYTEDGTGKILGGDSSITYAISSRKAVQLTPLNTLVVLEK